MKALYSLESDPELVSQSLTDLFGGNQLLSLATLDDDGLPYSNTAYFAQLDSARLVIFTEPRKHHSQNIESRSAFSATIFDSHQNGSPLKGLQLFGRGHLVTGDETDEAHRAYSKRFTWMAEAAPTYGDAADKFESRYYILNIEHLRVYDETRFLPEQIVDITYRP